MKRLLCRWFGHRYVRCSSGNPKNYVCSRCGEPGFWVPS